jgi:hypothetical protein
MPNEARFVVDLATGLAAGDRDATAVMTRR